MALQVSPSAGAIREETTVLQDTATGTGNGGLLQIRPGDVLCVRTTGADMPNARVAYEWSDDVRWEVWKDAALEDNEGTGMVQRVNSALVGATELCLRWVAPPGALWFRARISSYVRGNVTVVAIVQRRN